MLANLEHECSQAFVIINSMAVEYKSLAEAVDICFKSFYVFDVQYPKACAQVWEFLQSCVYEIPGPVRSSVQTMRAQLHAQTCQVPAAV